MQESRYFADEQEEWCQEDTASAKSPRMHAVILRRGAKSMFDGAEMMRVSASSLDPQSAAAAGLRAGAAELDSYRRDLLQRARQADCQAAAMEARQTLADQRFGSSSVHSVAPSDNWIRGIRAQSADTSSRGQTFATGTARATETSSPSNARLLSQHFDPDQARRAELMTTRGPPPSFPSATSDSPSHPRYTASSGQKSDDDDDTVTS